MLDVTRRHGGADDDPRVLPMQTREMPLTSIDAQARTVEVVFTTGATVRRRRYTGWDSSVPFDESLEVSRSAINLDRLNAGAPALDSHSAYSTSSQVGVIERAWIAGGEGHALIRFPSKGIDERADRMFALVSEGIIRNVSVGYSIDEVRVVEPEKAGDVEKRIVTRWTPFEVSFVTIPADAGAQVRAAESFPITINRAMSRTAGQQKGTTMTTSNTRTTETDADTTRAMSDAHVHEAYELALRHGVPAATVRQHIDSGGTLDAFRGIVLDRRAAAADIGISSRSGGETLDNPDFLAESIENALFARMSGTRPEGAAVDLMGRSLLDLGGMLLEQRGERPNWRNRERLASQILTRAHSTSDFSNLLTSTANRVLNNAYSVAQSPLMQIAKRRDAVDFRAMSTIKLSEAPRLSEVVEGGEVKHGTRAESVESFKVKSYAKIFALTRQAIINDDLGGFGDATAAFGRAAAQTEADLLASLLTANSGNGVNLADGSALYTTGRGNKAASGGAIDVTTLGAARQALRGMKDVDGKTPINVTPRHLVVGPTLETTAEQFLATLAANDATKVNPFSGKLALHVDPRLAGNAWRLFADPAEVATIMIAYLNGADGPNVSTREGWDVLGLEIRAVLDFGYGANDFRGTYLNPGA